MKKVNKNLVSVIMAFIVLLSSFTFVSSRAFAGESEAIVENSNSSIKSGDTDSVLDDTKKASWVEDIMTRILISFGDKVLLELLRSEDVLGPDLSIDAIVFDTYDKTKIDLYNSSGGSSANAALVKTVNYWFNVFETLAYIVYMIILVYIGIMIILHSGTGQQDKWKSYIGNWVLGLIMLAVLPRYGIPYLFKINSAFVSYIGKGHKTMQIYYNMYDNDGSSIYQNIMGSDSTTISVEKLVGLREEKEADRDETISTVVTKLKNLYNSNSQEIKNKLKNDGHSYELSDSEIDSRVDEYVDKRTENIVDFVIRWANRGYENEEIEELLVTIYYPYGGIPYGPEYFFNQNLACYFADVFLKKSGDDYVGVNENILNGILEVVAYTKEIGVIDEMIEIVQTDLMGMMRAYAGKYRRIIFALIWYVLFFQLISLVFIYFKRIFIIAILIAIFPLIMMSYALDKMSDGKSQTFSLWLKELLANVFLQSVHAIIYVTLIDVGLEIYKQDSENWIFLLASILMLLPAEALLKEIFGLEGSTIGRLGGMFEKMLAGGIAATKLATSFRGRKDATVTAKNKARFDKLQNRQNRADALAGARQNNRVARRLNPPSTAKEARKQNRQEFLSNARDKAYAVGSEARNIKAKVAPHIDNALRTARNVTGAAVGAGIALSGGDVNSLQEGAQVARAITGKTKKLPDEKVDIKSKLSSAYMRNKEKNKQNKNP